MKQKQTYLISKYMHDADYYDIFTLKTKKIQEVPQLKDLMLSFFQAFGTSFRILLSIREILGRLLNLKTAQKTKQKEREAIIKNFNAKIGEKIAIFEVLQANKIELLTGQSDKHLDFKLSFIRYKEKEDLIIKLITTVNIHNRLGHIYFTLVKPIHRFFMKRIIKRMEKILIKKMSSEIEC